MKVQKWAVGIFIISSLFVLRAQSSDCDKGDRGVDFSREYTGVLFDAFISVKDSDFRWKYGEAGVRALLKKVHTKFDRILVWIDTLYRKALHSMTSSLPEVVAKMNRENWKAHNWNTTQMRVIILFQFTSDYSRIDEEVTLGIQKIQNISDNANSIFPGTIEAILWHESNKINESVLRPFKLFCSYFKKCSETDEQTLAHQFPYKVGIMLSVTSSGLVHLEFEKEHPETTLVSILSKNLDIIYFEMDVEISLHLQENAAEAVTSITGKLDYIKTEYEKKSPDTEIGFYTSWPDTGIEGYASYSSLVHFWKGMDLWARRAKIPVVLHQAFDIPYLNIFNSTPQANDDTPDENLVKFRTTGWWRLLPSSDYRNVSDFVFEEKRCLPRKLLHELNRTWLDQEVHFNKEFIGVAFLPILGRNQSQYSESEMSGLIEHVTAHFSKVALFHFLRNELHATALEHGSSLILKLIAKLNSRKAHFKAGGGTEVILWFQKQSFSLIAELAKDANKVSPGTVKELVLDGQNNVKDWSKRVRESGYKFGISLSIGECVNYISFKESVAPILPHVDVIYLNELVNFEYSKLGYDRVSKEVTVAVEICRRNIKEHVARSVGGRKNVEVALISGWSYFKNSTDSNLVSLVRYWEFLNEWAAKTQITTILADAFDQLDWAVSVGSTYGWWKVVLLEANYGSDKWSKFVSKKKVLLEKVLDEEVRKSLHSSRLTYMVTVAAIVGPISLVFIIVSAVGVYIWKTRREQLSKSDINDFFQGVRSDQNEYSSDPLKKPYNDKRYEIGDGQFTVEDDISLGSGAFGSVCRGTVSLENGNVREVAVKTTKDQCPRSALMGLLSEVKILSHLEKHENLLELVGAHTTGLRKGRVLVFLEVCELGSLEGYLRNCKFRSDFTEEAFEMNDALTSDLLRWSVEIAKGMEFISAKHVVHLDLATRNVLLTADKVAKISDFGLSRRLENYQIYVKKQQEPLPWRWMSPEALHRLEFTEKSDVWAFGVTLWEIFSLADIPYPGLSWDVSFATQLDRGLRLEIPPFTQTDMYTIMLNCWETDPDKRPTFVVLKAILDKNKCASVTQNFLQCGDCKNSSAEQSPQILVSYPNSPDEE